MITFNVDISDDPQWDVGSIRLLSVSHQEETEAEPRKFVVVSSDEEKGCVRYELEPYNDA